LPPDPAFAIVFNPSGTHAERGKEVIRNFEASGRLAGVHETSPDSQKTHDELTKDFAITDADVVLLLAGDGSIMPAASAIRDSGNLNLAIALGRSGGECDGQHCTLGEEFLYTPECFSRLPVQNVRPTVTSGHSLKDGREIWRIESALYTAFGGALGQTAHDINGRRYRNTVRTLQRILPPEVAGLARTVLGASVAANSVVFGGGRFVAADANGRNPRFASTITATTGGRMGGFLPLPDSLTKENLHVFGAETAGELVAAAGRLLLGKCVEDLVEHDSLSFQILTGEKPGDKRIRVMHDGETTMVPVPALVTVSRSVDYHIPMVYRRSTASAR